MIVQRVTRSSGMTFEFDLTNREMADLIYAHPGCLDEYHFYNASTIEVLEHLVRIYEYLEDIRYNKEERNEV